jgi:DNA-directed RNA polymerase specialized sigma24 family protein
MFDLDELLTIARRVATRRFGHLPDRESLIYDVQSTAWENAKEDGGRHTLKSYVRFAVRDVRNRRHFRELTRSVDSPKPVRGQTPRPKRMARDVGELFHDETPARIAEFKIDYEEWFASLTEKQKQFAVLLALEHATEEVAAMMGCTEGNVSQYRERLRKSWYRFRADRE